MKHNVAMWSDNYKWQVTWFNIIYVPSICNKEKNCIIKYKRSETNIEENYEIKTNIFKTMQKLNQWVRLNI